MGLSNYRLIDQIAVLITSYSPSQGIYNLEPLEYPYRNLYRPLVDPSSEAFKLLSPMNLQAGFSLGSNWLKPLKGGPLKGSVRVR